MQKFFKNYPEFALIGLIAVLLAVIVFYSIWVIRTIIVAINGAVNASGAEKEAVVFDLAGARGLDLKGLVQ